MSQRQFHLVEEIFHEAIAHEASTRADYVRARCPDDEKLRAEIMSLLAEAETDHPSLDSFAWKLGLSILAGDADDLIGEVIGHFRILSLIGRGGMGRVFLAEDVRLNRHVAIKILTETVVSNPESVKRFRHEAKAASKISHPNVAHIYEFDEFNGEYFLAMEYVPGDSLRDLIQNGSIDSMHTLSYALQIASALSAAHRNGIIHRDIKPENVIVGYDQSVKVLDFGLAKFLERTHNPVETDIPETTPGLIIGTTAYMSPEQIRGQPLNQTSDIWSLGVVIYEMMVGERPFSGSNMGDVQASVLRDRPRGLNGTVSPPLSRILEKCLAKDPFDRYQLVSDLQADLKRVVVPADGVRPEITTSRSAAILSGNNGRTTDDQQLVREETRPEVIQHLWLTKLSYLAISVAAFFALLLGSWWLVARNRSSAETLGPMQSVPITSWSTISAEIPATAKFSPDARIIAFSSKRSGSSEIWIKPTVGGIPIEVTNNGFLNRDPIWSPDGQQIAFFSIRSGDGGLWEVNFTGGVETEIASGISVDARPVAWSSQGKIYYQDSSNLFTIDLVTGEREQLTAMPKEVFPSMIAVSRDLSAFAVALREDGLWKLRAKRFDKDSFTELVSEPEAIQNIVFHPNGDSVLFSREIKGSTQIFEAGPDLTSPHQISFGNNDSLLQDISANGSRVLYSSTNESSDLWVVNTTDGKESVVANDVSEEYWPSISPDGKSVAYQSKGPHESPNHAAILVKPLWTAGTPTMVTSDGYSPTWSTNGQWIAFLQDLHGETSLWRARPMGAETLRLGGGETISYLVMPYLKTANNVSWSPDSRDLAFISDTEGTSNIQLGTPEGSQDRPVTANTDLHYKYCCVMWTRDSSKLAFVANSASPRTYRLLLHQLDNAVGERTLLVSQSDFRFLGFTEGDDEVLIAQKTDPKDQSQIPATTQIFAISIASGTKRAVNTLKNSYFYNIHLSPNGKTIAFAARTDDASELWTVPALGGTARRIFVEKDPKVMFSSLAWAPDGTFLVFGKQTQTNLLSMLTNDL
jgi:serine/threonine protein kinase